MKWLVPLSISSALVLAPIAAQAVNSAQFKPSGQTPHKTSWWKRNLFQRPAGWVEKASDRVNTFFNPFVRRKNIHSQLDEIGAQFLASQGMTVGPNDRVTTKLGTLGGLFRGGTSIFRGSVKPGELHVYVNGRHMGSTTLDVDKSGLVPMIFKPYRWLQPINKVSGETMNKSRMQRVVSPLPQGGGSGGGGGQTISPEAYDRLMQEAAMAAQQGK